MKTKKIKNNYEEYDYYYARKEERYNEAFKQFINWLKKIFL